jgi:hypothetical protein
MRTAFPVQELPARNAPIVVVSCVNHTETCGVCNGISVRLACPSIQCTPKLHQQTTEFESEKGLKLRTLANYAEWPSGRPAFSVSVLLVVHFDKGFTQYDFVRRTLGSGFSEDVYDRAMQVGLRLAKIGYEGSFSGVECS